MILAGRTEASLAALGAQLQREDFLVTAGLEAGAVFMPNSPETENFRDRLVIPDLYLGYEDCGIGSGRVVPHC